MDLKKIIKSSFLWKWLKKNKQACLQVKKNKRVVSKLDMILGSFSVRKFNSISGNKLNKLFEDIDYPKQSDRFYYYIDENISITCDKLIVGNIPVDYSLCLSHSLLDFKNEKSVSVVSLIEKVIKRIVGKNKEQRFSTYLTDFLNFPCSHFEEALQRILFVNQLLWQTQHTLVGLGRLDFILTPFYEKDITSNCISMEEAKEMLRDFMLTLHKHYNYKSNTLLGDTGQIIVLGGKEENESYFCSELTRLFVEVTAELKLPDPKILIRVAENMPRDLMEAGIRCMCTGIGSPLLANDEKIIPGLIHNGYDIHDAYEYATSACWEPLIPGKSTDQNNVGSFKLTEIINSSVDNIVKSNKETFDFSTFVAEVKEALLKQLQVECGKCLAYRYERDPMQSLFLHNTFENGTDLADGDVKYNYSGILAPGFSNGINSLLNIKRLVFETKKYTLKQLNDYRKRDFDGFDISELKNTGSMYGEDEDEVISLTNDIIQCVDSFCKSHKNQYGFTFKFGLSSPSYIDASVNSEASFDGRKNGEPFGVHISSNKQVPYTEIINFGSKLDYSSANIDGNVVDFIVSPSFVENHFDKFVDFMLLSIKNGFFEMQMNVLSSALLKDAKAHPENHKDLIVRVWGFSAYFVDLPIEYKDLLIKRAEINEGISR